MTRAAKLVAGFALLSGTLCSGADNLSAARSDARAGKVDAAIADLTADPRRAGAQALLCQLYGSIDERDLAIAACEAASMAAPSSSEDALQLARAYGDKADHSGALTGMRMVGKIRDNFERAVRLDPDNVDALSDLGEFYVQAPGLAGGGVDKARPLVTRLEALSPARAHRLAAMIAAKTKDEAAAQQEYEAELAVAHSPEAYVDLANFYRGRKQSERAADYARMAIEHDMHHGPDTLDAVVILIDLKSDLKAAQKGLRGYLSSPQTGAVARCAKAHVLLAQTLQASGNAAGAQQEYAAALLLAHNYEPARKGTSK